MKKQMVSFRLTPAAFAVLREISAREDCNRTVALELAVREAAAARRISVAPEPREALGRLGSRRAAPR